MNKARYTSERARLTRLLAVWHELDASSAQAQLVAAAQQAKLQQALDDLDADFEARNARIAPSPVACRGRTKVGERPSPYDLDDCRKPSPPRGARSAAALDE